MGSAQRRETTEYTLRMLDKKPTEDPVEVVARLWFNDSYWAQYQHRFSKYIGKRSISGDLL